MRIFYTASYYGKEKYQKYYDLVLNTLSAMGVEVLSPEKGNYLSILNKLQIKKLKGDKRKTHYEAIRKGILWAQGVIIEVSNEDFQLGHEATLAIQDKKHVLCLSVNEDFSTRINSPYFHGIKYNEYNIEEIIENFIKLAGNEQLNERFNLFLSSRQLSALSKAAETQGLNKSEYLRWLIDNKK